MSEQIPLSGDKANVPGFLRRQVDVPAQDAAPQTYPRRAEQLHHQLRQNTHGAQVQIPDQAVVAEITRASSKIHYWPTDAGFESSTDQRIDYWKYVAEPLLTHVLQKYPDKQVAVRAAPVSINGTFLTQGEDYSEESFPLYDIAEAVATGSDKHPSHPYFSVAYLSSEDGKARLDMGTNHVSEFADSVTYARWESCGDETERQDALFSALFVYDGVGLQRPIDEAGNSVRFGAWARSIRPDLDPSQVLLEAYILDAGP